MARVPLNDLTLEGTTPPRFAVGAQVYIYERGTTTETVVYPTEAGGSPLTQPLTVDAKGYTPGWVDEGSYDREIDGETFPFEALSAQGIGLNASAFVQTVLDDETAEDARETLGTASADELQDHIDDAGAHTASNQEKAHAAVTSSASVGTSEADVTGLTVTFTAGPRPILLHAFLPTIYSGTASSQVTLYLTDDSNTKLAAGVVRVSPTALLGNYYGDGINVFGRLTGLTDGVSYTFKVRAIGTVAHTIPASSTQPAFLRAQEC